MFFFFSAKFLSHNLGITVFGGGSDWSVKFQTLNLANPQLKRNLDHRHAKRHTWETQHITGVR